MKIEFDIEDEEAVSELIAKLRGKHDTRDFGDDASVYAFILLRILSSFADRSGKEAEAEQRGESTWLDQVEGRYECLLDAGQYLKKSLEALLAAVGEDE